MYVCHYELGWFWSFDVLYVSRYDGCCEFVDLCVEVDHLWSCEYVNVWTCNACCVCIVLIVLATASEARIDGCYLGTAPVTPVCLAWLAHVLGVAPHGVVWLSVTPRVCLAKEVQAQSCHTDRRNCSHHIPAQHSNYRASHAKRTGATRLRHEARSHRTPWPSRADCPGATSFL
jgi:hypothetical protein